MPKPFSLSLYTPVHLAGTQKFVKPLGPIARGWKHSNRSMGGSWQGSFRVEGDANTLVGYFTDWLGYDLQERAGGVLSWRGLIYEMDLTVNGITRKRTLDLMANRVKTTYGTMDYVGDNFVINAGFEDYTVAAPDDDFWGWYEAHGTDGSVQLDVGHFHGGAASVRLDSDSDGLVPGDIGYPHTYIRQNLQVTPGANYKLSFWTLGDGVASNLHYGLWGIRNPNAPTSWLKGPWVTSWSSHTAWHQVTAYFQGPSEGEIMLFFIAPYGYDTVGGASYSAWFDDAVILEEAQCVYETTWQEGQFDPGSPPLDRFGVKEEVVHLDAYPEATSQAYRDTFYAEHAWPWPRCVSASKPGEASLDVLACGYVFTMNWMYVQAGDGAAHDLDDWLWLIVGTQYGRSPLHGGTVDGAGDCQFVVGGAIDANTLQVPQLTNVEERPWDVIQELAALGDVNGNPWRAWVGPARQFHYRAIDTAPRYFLRKDGIFDTMAGNAPTNPWLMQPATVRDMAYRYVNNAEPRSFLPTTSDFYVEEVEMADGWDGPALKTVLFSEADLLQRQNERG